MKKIETKLKDCFILEPDRFGDNRGYFESVTEEYLRSLGFKGIKQVNNSLSAKGIVRAFHYQKDPYCQAKVVCVKRGAVYDLVIDLRKDSPSYGMWEKVLLTPENGRYLYVPRGFAHGFVSLKDDTLFEYFVDNKYKPSFEEGFMWNDKDINVDWDSIFKEFDINEVILSDKDKVRPNLNDLNLTFTRTPKRYLITGFKGQLGYDLVRCLKECGEEDILAIDVDDMDITDREKVFKVVNSYKPDVIFHCAAWTQVDKAEDMEEKVYDINVNGTKNLTDASIEVGSKIVYMSTDYVFDGTKDGLYKEDDITNPKSVYGNTKYLGEEEVRRNPNHFITRISWVFGINGNNFVKTMKRLSETKNKITVVDDQIGSPTYTVDLAKLLVEMVQTEKYGTYNVTNEGYCSWAEFAKEIMKKNNKDTEIIPVSTEEYLEITNTKQAYRPRNSKMDKSKLEENGFSKLPSWQDALDRYFIELENDKVLKYTK